jgi:hypothetical protein
MTRSSLPWTTPLGRTRTESGGRTGLVMLGISLEYLQRLSGYHTFEYADMGANTAGVLCALPLAQTRLSRTLAVVEGSMLRFIGAYKRRTGGPLP